MSRITASAEVMLDSLPGPPEEEWLPPFLEQYNELSRQVVANINQSTPLLDCPTSKLLALNLTHAASITVKNPLSVPIRAIHAVACVGLSVDSTGKPNRGVYDLGIPLLEWHNSTKSDGSVVIVPSYPLSVGETLTVARTSNTADFVTTVEATVTWSGVTTAAGENAGGSVLSWDSTTGIVVSKAGVYSVHGHASWANSAAGNRQAHINLGGTRTFSSEIPTSSGGNFLQQDTFGLFGVTSTPLTVTLSGSQNSGGNLAMNGSGALSQRSGEGNRTFMQVIREKNLETPLGRVGLLFLGGS